MRSGAGASQSSSRRCARRARAAPPRSGAPPTTCRAFRSRGCGSGSSRAGARAARIRARPALPAPAPRAAARRRSRGSPRKSRRNAALQQAARGAARYNGNRVRVFLRIPAASAALGLAVALSLAVPARAQNAPLFGAEAGAAAPEKTALADLQQEVARFETHTAEWQAKAAEYEKAQRDAPAEIAKIDAEVARLSAPGDVAVPTNATLDQLEVLAIGAEQDLSLAQREATELETEAETRSERRRQLPQLLADAKARAAAPVAGVPPTAGEEAAVVAAREQLAQQRRAAFEVEVHAYEQELLSYETRGRVLDRKVALARERVAREQAKLDALQRVLAERRKAAATHAVESALDSIQEAASLSPEVRDVVRHLAEENAELARVRTGESGVLESIDDVTRRASSRALSGSSCARRARRCRTSASTAASCASGRARSRRSRRARRSCAISSPSWRTSTKRSRGRPRSTPARCRRAIARGSIPWCAICSRPSAATSERCCTTTSSTSRSWSTSTPASSS
ncbi:MAG: hypothetical protein E6J87_21795 [Deltaproteobacteria bacterium]|nr:MAG: hypothetical protein E6J87_21795 [Deltaproteobacteria bacterium]